MKKLILSVFCIVLTLFGVAQNYFVVSEVLDESGISIQGINDIEEDEKGYLWIFTSNSVYRYDGFKLVSFYNIPDDSTSFPFRGVYNADMDENQVFWISDGFDLSWCKNGKRATGPKGTKSIGLAAEMICQNGFTFFATNQGFAFYDGNQDSTFFVPAKTKIPSPENFKKLEKKLQSNLIADISKMNASDKKEVSFEVAENGTFLVYSLGEYYSDFGSLKDQNELVIWEPSEQSAFAAGGASKNKLYLDKVELKPGNYTLTFQTDESHNYGSWNDLPPTFSDLWGIRIYALNENVEIELQGVLENLIEQPGVLSETGYAMCTDEKGNVYYLSERGIDKFNASGQFIAQYEMDLHQQFQSAPVGYYAARGMGYDILAVKENLLVISGPTGFVNWNLATGNLRFYSVSEYPELRGARINTLFRDQTNNYLVGTSSGIRKLRPATMNLEYVVPGNKFLQTEIRGIYQDRNKNYYAFNNRNLYKIAPSRFNEIELPLSYTYMSNEQVFYVDSKKNIWFLDTAKQLAVHNDEGDRLIAFDIVSYLNQNNFPANQNEKRPVKMIFGVSDSLILVNVLDQYLISVNPLTREILYVFDFRDYVIKGIYKDQFEVVRVFCTTTFFELNSFDEITSVGTMPAAQQADEDHYFGAEHFRFLYEDVAQKKIYFEWSNSLFILETSSDNVSRINLKLLNDRELAFNCGDGLAIGNHLYFASVGQLMRLDLETDSLKYFPHCNPLDWYGYKPTVVKQDQAGNILMTTLENGLLIFNPTTEKYTRFSRKDGLIDNKIHNLFADNQNRIWISTPRGISILDLKDTTFQNYSESDLPGKKPTDYSLWYNGSDRSEITYFTPTSLVKINSGIINTSKPLIDVFDLKMNEHDFLSDQEFAYDQNNLTFEFVVLDLTSPKMNKYAYQLQGYDQDWVTGDYTIRKVKYMNLPAGEYVLKVKGTNASGVWSDELVVAEFVILLPWWQTIWFRILIIVLILVITFLIIKWRTKKLKDRQKQLEEKIDEATFEIRLQKDEIQVQHREIKDSIQYAKRIQEAILPPSKIVKEWLEDSFIIYKPKDIVAGDFYWLDSVKSSVSVDGNRILFAVGDCTGHGVPGAMVSVVCHNALNRCVREFGLTTPSQILDKTRDLIIDAFSADQTDVKDGMDAALVSLEFKTDSSCSVQYSGANNGLYLIKDGAFVEIKPDKQPIGRFAKQTPFTNHQIELKKGDTIYLFSDGFADQFGGPKGKKFKYEAFREMIMRFSSMSMAEQRIHIESTYESWRGDFEQLDDICIIGVRV
jgi:serine phosphatase RsbU (regulator of sigma subunit)/ligand-binding sensor domain-containing protein